MEKLTLTKVVRTDRVSKENKSYVSISIKTREYGDRFLSGFGAVWNQDWKEGGTVEVDVTKKPSMKDGKPVEYLNFTKPNPLVDFAKTIMALSVRVGALEKMVEQLERRPDGIPVVNTDEDVPPVTDEDYQGDSGDVL